MVWWLIVLGLAAGLLLIRPVREFLLRTVSAIRGFVREVVEELKKVSWPTRRELKNSTGLVILSMLMLMVFIGVIDLLLNAIIGLITGGRK